MSKSRATMKLSIITGEWQVSYSEYLKVKKQKINSKIDKLAE
jgi:hypothetical protein